MKFEVREEKVKFVKWAEGLEFAMVFKGFTTTRYGEAISGVDVETKEAVLVPLTATLEKLKNEFLEKGDVIAFRCRGTKKAKFGKFSYYDIVFTVYKNGKDFKLEEIFGEDIDSSVPF